MSRILAFILAGGVIACAPTTQRPSLDPEAVKAEALEQRIYAERRSQSLAGRLERVDLRVATAAVDLCGKQTAHRTGLTVLVLSKVSPERRERLRPLFPEADDTAPMVIRVTDGSPAEAAGLRRGDIITAINGSPVTAKTAVETFDEAAKAETLRLTVRRAGQGEERTVTPVVACDYPARLTEDLEINAFADGEAIMVTTGMMDFAQTDEELALVLGHELAHNLRGHIDAGRANAIGGQVLGSLVDILIAGATGVNTGGLFGRKMQGVGRGVYSQAFEHEADYVGLYLVARAGYAIDEAPFFWRRMAAAHPEMITHASTHPASPERAAALRATAAEIRAKRDGGLPLRPNEDGASPAPAEAAAHK